MAISYMMFPLINPTSPTDLQAFSVFIVLINWCLVEVIRFGFYASKQSQATILSNFFGHLRYNVFIVAYILGVLGEILGIIFATRELNKLALSEHPYTILMPNAWNFAFHFECFAIISPFLYLPGFPGLYMHMWRQRAKFYAVPTSTDKKLM